MLAPAILLVAEDQPAERDTAADMPRFGGWRVIAATEEREALAALEMGEAIGVLLPDVVMPGMNGVELAREARRLCPGLSGLLASGETGAKGIHRWGVLGNDTGTRRGCPWLE